MALIRRIPFFAALVAALFGMAPTVTGVLLPQATPAPQVDASGALNLQVPFDLPIGAGGATPRIGLSYNSNSGNGIAGVGWRLEGLLFLTRNPLGGIRYDGADGYLSSAHGELVDVGGGIYHSKRESLTRFLPVGSCGAGPCMWTAQDPAGGKYFFGHTEDSRIEAPGRAGSIRVWALNRFEDPFGNSYDIFYIEDNGSYRPQSIRYANREIIFQYEARSDRPADGTGGALAEESERLARVRVRAGDLERNYELVYQEADYSRVSRLVRINRTGTNSHGTEDFEEIVFSYSDPAYGLQSAGSRGIPMGIHLSESYEPRWHCDLGAGACVCVLAALAGAPCQGDQGSYVTVCQIWNDDIRKACEEGYHSYGQVSMLGDIDGNGGMDFVDIGGHNSMTLRAWHLGEGGYTETTSFGFDFDKNASTYLMADIDGDGRSDLYYGHGGGYRVRFNDGSSFSGYAGVPSATRLQDINADGRADLITIAPNALGIEIRANLSVGRSFSGQVAGSVPSLVWKQTEIGGLPGVTVPIAPFVELADINGDGLADLVQANGTTLRVTYLSASLQPVLSQDFAVSDEGRAGSQWMVDVNADGRPDFVRLSGASRLLVTLLTGAEVRHLAGPYISSLQFGDLNADGIVELVDVAAARVYFWDGSGYSDASSYSLGIGDIDYVVDVNGDGRADFVRTHRGEKEINGTIEVFFTNSGPSHKLVSATSGENSFFVEYADARLAGAAVQVGSPRSYPNLPDVSPRSLVRRTTVRNGMRKTESGFAANEQTTAFGYVDARVHMGLPAERAGLGFERIIVRDESTGAREEREFHQTKALAGLERESRMYGPEGNILRRSQAPAAGFRTTNPFPGTEMTVQEQTTEQQYQGGVLLFTATSTVEHDAYGNPTVQTVTRGGSSTVVRTTYENDLANWRVGRPLAVEQEVDGVLLGRQETAYAGAAVASQRVLVLPSNEWAVVAYEYDGRGNATAVTDPTGRRTTYHYDQDVGRFVVRTVNALGHAVATDYDTSLGLPLRTTDPNGNSASTTYDAHGRRMTTTRSGEASYSEEFVYRDWHDSQMRYVEHRRRDGSAGDGYLWSREYVDGAGRVYRAESEGYVDLASGNAYRIMQETVYDDRGRVARRSNSFVPGVTPALFEVYEYGGPDGALSAIRHRDGSQTRVTLSGMTTTVVDRAGRTHASVRNARGQVTEKAGPLGTVTRYAYDAGGRLNRVTDPGGAVTTAVYDNLGRKIDQTDPSRGRTTAEYDRAGRMTARTDARGIRATYEYDDIGRLVRIDRPDENDVVYRYDEPGVANGRGRLTSIQNRTASEFLSYTPGGLVETAIKKIDQYTFSFRAEYDQLGRVQTVTLPDGSRIGRRHSDSGRIVQVSLDNFPVVSYAGPFLEEGWPALSRTTSNGVRTVIRFNVAAENPAEAKTTLPDGTVAQDWTLVHDASGNLLEFRDNINANRSQTFEYDALDRLSRARGKNKTEPYDHVFTYSAGGNLLGKGPLTLDYDPARPHLVRTVSGQGVVTYHYDSAGNATSRGTHRFEHDTAGNLAVVLDSGLNVLQTYGYDHQGRRIKKRAANGATVMTVGAFGAEYEFALQPGKPTLHTIYVRGFEGELAAQQTKTDVSLAADSPRNMRAIASRFDWTIAGLSAYAAAFGDKGEPTGVLSASPVAAPSLRAATRGVRLRVLHFCEFGGGRATFVHLRKATLPLRGHPALVLVAALFIFVFILFMRAYVRWRQHIYLLQARPGLAVTIPLVLPVLLFTLSGCVGIPGLGEAEKEPPWLVVPSGIDQSTPGIQDPPGSASAAAGGGSSGTPVTGMYFFHPDHLGSVRLVTDARGRHVQGVDIATGKSYVDYMPYGEINRTNSDGPDIFRHKYTGQPEDPETGLYYYKTRYYDPGIGRFLQADIVADSTEAQGMNPYMYVNGNPVKYRDPRGMSAWSSFFKNLIRDFNRFGRNAMVDQAKFVQHFNNVSQRIAEGKGHDDPTDSVNVGLRKVRDAGTFVRRALTSSKFIAGVFEGAVDYVASLIHNAVAGKPAPYVTYHHGGYAIHNSYMASHNFVYFREHPSEGTVSYEYGGVAHIKKGSSRQTRLHEQAHIHQEMQGGGLMNFGPFTEWDADIRAGTFRYTNSGYIMKQIIGPELYRALTLVNSHADPLRTVLQPFADALADSALHGRASDIDMIAFLLLLRRDLD